MATLIQVAVPLPRQLGLSVTRSLHRRLKMLSMSGVIAKIKNVDVVGGGVAPSANSSSNWSAGIDKSSRDESVLALPLRQTMRSLAPFLTLVAASCASLAAAHREACPKDVVSLEPSVSTRFTWLTAELQSLFTNFVGYDGLCDQHLSTEFSLTLPAMVVVFLSLLKAAESSLFSGAGRLSSEADTFEVCGMTAGLTNVLYMDNMGSWETERGEKGSRMATGGSENRGKEGGGVELSQESLGPPGRRDDGKEEDWFLANDALVRAMPLLVGGVGGCLVVLNRVLSGIAPVADASSGQSRADVLALVLSATLLLTGLTWKSVQPKAPVTVQLQGVECLRMNPALPPSAYQELSWTWRLLRTSMRCRALVIIYAEQCVMQAGIARRSESGSGEAQAIDALDLVKKPICGGVMGSGKANYLANLALFPGRIEFDFLPSNTQAVIVHPLGNEGLLILASDTVRGFRPIDQSWIAIIGEKIDSTLQDVQQTLQNSTPIPSS